MVMRFTSLSDGEAEEVMHMLRCVSKRKTEILLRYFFHMCA